MNITEKSAYIKGLAEGLQLDGAKPETKVIHALLDLVSELSEKVSELEHDVETLNDYIDEVDEDLGFVEDLVYEDGCCGGDEEDDELSCDLDCAHCANPDACDGDDEDDGEEDGFRCLMCPSCGEKIYFDESIDPSDLICPACGKSVCEDDEKDDAEFVK